ncbi:MAG TPA: hypothetical protein VJ698_22665 [Noviherbaspirillum sp.]|uniref:hypothetical protein n=1 Tax=Noviherbaspirillum sp. TaxID=1926288 RepID=UPI002B4A0C2B|nr:hypothetical protein [Noviherbaspirillum sp.]HJV88290.1 hypothetical protein [Noviherbaspirillum sp.]
MNIYIQDAIEVIKSHPRIRSVEVREAADGKSTIAAAVFDTNLPSTWRANGASPTGVRPEEEVEILFPADFPKTAPIPTLRPDFNSSLPHINAHRAGDRVPPCVFSDSILELLHSDGVLRLVEQIVNWLDDAAENTLVKNKDGWEPTRRYRNVDLLMLDTEAIAKHRPKRGGLQIYDASIVWSRSKRESYGNAENVRVKSVFYGMDLRSICEKFEYRRDTAAGKTLLAICWPEADYDGNCPAIDEYRPDSVRTYADLLNRSREYKCEQALALFIKYFNQAAKDLPLRGHLPIYIALAVKRPMRLLGMMTDYELLAYRLDPRIPEEIDSNSMMPASTVTMIEPVSASLLRRTSGLKETDQGLIVTHVGCGSLGSKIILHTARAGYQTRLIVDDTYFAAHNSARHVLHPLNAMTLESKTIQVAQLVAQYTGSHPFTYEGKVQDLPMQDQNAKLALDSPNSIVVNTTGSTVVRQYLASSDISARVVEGCAMNLGEIGVMSIEGSERNPSTVDLISMAYEVLRQSELLTVPDNTNTNLLRIGVGCNSVTLPMSDARISLIASGIGQALLTMHQEGVPPDGKLSVARVLQDGMSILWHHFEVGKTRLANLTDTGGWSVRVLDAAHRKIAEEVNRYQKVETGGVIVGRISALTREVFITDVIEAPRDSKRTPAQFILGTEGLTERIRQYEMSGKGVLWCLGTWHSHIGAFGPSLIDIDTADSLQGKLKEAAVLLIHRPDGYSAVIRK